MNAGLIILEKKAADHFDASCGSGWSNIIDPLCKKGMISVFTNPSIKYFNVGTEEELKEVRLFFQKYNLTK